MAAKGFRFGVRRAAASVAGFDQQMTQLQELRNAFRDTLDPVKYKISDIARWAGSGTSSPEGIAFLIRNMDTTCEWILGVVHRGVTTGLAYTSYISSAADLVNENNSSVTSLSWGLFIKMNDRYDTSTFGFGFDANLNLVGGDFSAPLVSPMLSDFWPLGKLRGIMYNFTTQSTNLESYIFNFVMEEDLDVFSSEWRGHQELGVPYAYHAFGNIFINDSFVDLDSYGVFGCLFSTSVSPTAGFFGRVGVPHAFFRDGLDTQQFGSFYSRGTLTYSNERNPDGFFKRMAISVSSSGYTKGHLNPDLFPEIGAFERATRFGLRVNTPAGQCIKTNGVFAVFFDPTVPYPPQLQGITLFNF